MLPVVNGRLWAITLSGVIMILCGCTPGMRRNVLDVGPEFSIFGGGRVTSAGVNQLFDEKLETNLLNGSINQWC